MPTRSVSRTVSTNRQHHTLPGVLKQEFYLLDRVRKRDLTIDGWYVALGRYDRVTYSAVEAGLSPKFDAAVETDFVPVDPALCEPRRWDEGPVTDFERLKVKKPDGYSGSERPVPPPADYLTALGTRVRTRQ